jgi:hypothetical protein
MWIRCRQRIVFVFFTLCVILFCASCETSSSPEKTISPEEERLFAGYARQYANDPELGTFLKKFSQAVQAADWQAVLSFFDEENYRQQTEIGIGQKQYILEGMDLSMSEFIDADDSVNLNHLQSLVYHVVSLAVDDYYAVVTGDATLANGRTIPFRLRIIRYSDGRFAIAPPLG